MDYAYDYDCQSADMQDEFYCMNVYITNLVPWFDQTLTYRAVARDTVDQQISGESKYHLFSYVPRYIVDPSFEAFTVKNIQTGNVTTINWDTTWDLYS